MAIVRVPTSALVIKLKAGKGKVLVVAMNDASANTKVVACCIGHGSYWRTVLVATHVLKITATRRFGGWNHSGSRGRWH